MIEGLNDPYTLRKAAAATYEGVVSSEIVAVDGSVAAGAREVTFVPSPDFDGTILGSPIPSGVTSLPFVANGNGTLGEIEYTRTAGTLTIYKVV